jgi:hypothetical protein
MDARMYAVLPGVLELSLGTGFKLVASGGNSVSINDYRVDWLESLRTLTYYWR